MQNKTNMFCNKNDICLENDFENSQREQYNIYYYCIILQSSSIVKGKYMNTIIKDNKL